ncbi:TRAP transporter permease [Natribaculum luteum]|uniref:TRAP transporter permease n=1 Tax=Natribaculum luteum TaxID=1586232 RepID=A0ABD5P5Q7_9EURY|nr:TRAP transporter fused permease subunit [Natribaculum luteum]
MGTLDTERNQRPLDTVLTIGALLFWVGVIAYAHTQMIATAKYGIAFLGGVLILYVIDDLRDVIEEENYLSLALLAVSSVVIVITTAYMFSNFKSLYQETLGTATTPQLALALAFTLVIVYLTWRSFGMTFLVVLLAGIAYGLFGDLVPGMLGHGGITPERMLRTLVLEVQGFFGSLNRLVATWIALFLLYAGLLKGYGAFDLILRLAVRSAKYVSSGVAQTAVIASAVIGSVNGSQTANAGMTGSFTIPMMKENGVKPATAGGIEAVASTSGQVLPPVMGAAAFIMGSLIMEITYVDVIVAGLIPAAILVVSIAVAVHYVAAPQIDDPEMEGYFEEAKSTGELAFDGLKFLIPLAVLIYVLGIIQYTVQTAALYTTIAMIATGTTFPIVKSVYKGSDVTAAFVDVLKQTVDGAREGAVVLAPVAIILAAINGVVDILMTTGVPTSISLALMDLSGGVLLVAAIMSMVICIILGLGMPTTAAYTVVALLVAPTLVNQFMLPDLAAHYFVFYAAILAGLTPPIATCAAVACGIAGADFMETAWEGLKISAPLYVLPFVFIYHPEVVSGEFTTASLSAGFIAMLGALAIIHGINYRFSFGRGGTAGSRVIFFVLGIVAMVHPDLFVQIGALVAAIGLYAVQKVVGEPELDAAGATATDGRSDPSDTNR